MAPLKEEQAKEQRRNGWLRVHLPFTIEPSIPHPENLSRFEETGFRVNAFSGQARSKNSKHYGLQGVVMFFERVCRAT
jgi:hypothetical protein